MFSLTPEKTELISIMVSSIPSPKCIHLTHGSLQVNMSKCKKGASDKVTQGSEKEAEWGGGELGVLLMIGGQGTGTHLDSSGPKGCYDIDLPLRRALFPVSSGMHRAFAAGRAGRRRRTCESALSSSRRTS